jgi:hypothetical protein
MQGQRVLLMYIALIVTVSLALAVYVDVLTK